MLNSFNMGPSNSGAARPSHRHTCPCVPVSQTLTPPHLSLCPRPSHRHTCPCVPVRDPHTSTPVPVSLCPRSSQRHTCPCVPVPDPHTATPVPVSLYSAIKPAYPSLKLNVSYTRTTYITDTKDIIYQDNEVFLTVCLTNKQSGNSKKRTEISLESN